MAEDLQALRSASSGHNICCVLTEIGNNLDNNTLLDRYIGQGLVEYLRDLTITSTDTGVRLSVLSFIIRVIADRPETKQKLLQPMGFLRELAKLCSPIEDDGKHDHEKNWHLSCHNQAADLIKTLVLNSECMVEVASIDLIGQMVQLCGVFFDGSRHTSCCHSNLEYPPRATSYLHELTQGRKLIGKVQKMLPDFSRREASKVKEIFDNEVDIDVLSVDLYDTTTDKDIAIKDELVKEKMAWPQFLSPEQEAKMFAKCQKNGGQIWADVTVTSVIDGGHFWAQVGGEVVDEKLRDIRLILQNEDQVGFPGAPEIGELVCCRTTIGGHQDIYRGKVLQVLSTQEEVMVELFAVDYGFKNVVSMECITQITPVGRKEPFQARLCCLSGVQPLSSNVKVLANAAGALRNLAYHSNGSRLQILDKNGIDALLKLIILPEKEVRRQAIGAILNLSINLKTRARIGLLGIKILLDLIQNDYELDNELLYLAVGVLRNVMLDCPVNRGRVAEVDGLIILTSVYFASCDNDVKQQCLGALKNLVGNSWYLLTGNDGVDLRSITDKEAMNSLTLSTALNTSKHSPVQRRTRLRPGEVEPQPIEKALPSHVIKPSTTHEAESPSQSQDEITDGDTDGEEKLLCPSPSSPHERHCELNQEISSFYVRGQAMPCSEDDTHEFRPCKETRGLSASVVTRPGCGFLNAGKGGTVYLGVKKSGIISGVEISRKDRDRLRLGVDEMLGEFKPAVRYDKYQVNFVPVTEEESEKCERKNIELIPDLYVVEVSFNKCSGTVYTTNKNRCYFRCGNTNSEFSIQDVRKWVLREQETFYNEQISLLKRELSAARQRQGADGV